jgi:hypothetical protein
MIISTRLLQVVNSLFQTCCQLGTSSANTTCRQLVGRLATRCEIVSHIKSLNNRRKIPQLVDKMCSHCLLTPSSLQVWNKLSSSCNKVDVMHGFTPMSGYRLGSVAIAACYEYRVVETMQRRSGKRCLPVLQNIGAKVVAETRGARGAPQ